MLGHSILAAIATLISHSPTPLSPLFSLPSPAAQSLSVARCTLPRNGAGCREVKECNGGEALFEI